MDILFVSANSRDEYIDIEREHRTLQKLVETGGHSLRVLPAAEVSDLRDALRANEKERAFDILHFSGHATQKEGLHLRGEGRQKEVLGGETLKELLKGSGVKLVVLNACHSEALAVSLSEVVPATIGTTRIVRDVAARRFTRHFYSALKDNATVKDAFETALKKQKQSSSPAFMHAGRTTLRRIDHSRIRTTRSISG
jgi:hypothetical protein